MAYFDNNATTRPLPEALAAHDEAMRKSWLNPSSPFRAAANVRARLNKAREDISSCFGLGTNQVTFSSGATEANNSVFAHAAHEAEDSARVVLSSIEHPSVSEPASYWFGDRVSRVAVEPSGVLDLEFLETLLDGSDSICLVSLMAANNETGVLQPWREVAELCRLRGIPFHCDATQWVGKLPSSEFSVCSSFTASAHKFGGPKGLGILGGMANSFVLGGNQENGNRGGTENFPAVDAMKVALEIQSERVRELPLRSAWRDSFERSMEDNFPGLQIAGRNAPRLWNTSMLLVPDYENLSYLGKLDKLGFEVSTGSACSSGIDEDSGVPKAMGYSSTQSKRLIRISSFIDETENDWKELAEAFCVARDELDRESGNSSVISI